MRVKCVVDKIKTLDVTNAAGYDINNIPPKLITLGAECLAGPVTYIHCSKYSRDQIFKAVYLEIYWEKSFKIVVPFS